MQVSEALTTRRTCRAFLSKPVPAETIRAIVDGAHQAPSGGNVQPWRVWALAGRELDDLTALVGRKMGQGLFGDGSTEYEIYPQNMKEPYASRVSRNAETVYNSIGVARTDQIGRARHNLRSYEFFGAPAAFFFAIDRSFNQGQWADLGMFMQSMMLLAREHGLHTAALESWAYWHRTVSEHLGIPPELMLFCGMALGHMDESHPVNGPRVGRAPVEEIATFLGC